MRKLQRSNETMICLTYAGFKYMVRVVGKVALIKFFNFTGNSEHQNHDYLKEKILYFNSTNLAKGGENLYSCV